MTEFDIAEKIFLQNHKQLLTPKPHLVILHQQFYINTCKNVRVRTLANYASNVFHSICQQPLCSLLYNKGGGSCNKQVLPAHAALNLLSELSPQCLCC